MLSRRNLLQGCLIAISAGSSGCLGLSKSAPQPGLLLVNSDTEPRTVEVSVTTTAGKLLYKGTLTIPAENRIERDLAIDSSPIVVSAQLESNPHTTTDGELDFRGCREAGAVISVRDNAIYITGQDVCDSDETIFSKWPDFGF